MNIFLFNKSLRCTDNTTLIYQNKIEKKVTPIFVFTEQVNSEFNHYINYNSIKFMIESLIELSEEITKKKGELYFFHHNNLIETLQEIHLQKPIMSIGTNFDYSPYAISRQEQLKIFCDDNKITFYLKEDHVLHDILGNETKKSDNTPYSVFTPFRNHCCKLPIREPDKFKKFIFEKHSILKKNKYNVKKKKLNQFIKSDLEVNSGRKNAKNIIRNLKKFLDYEEERDILTYQTTRLAVHNHFGTVSIREVYYTVMKEGINGVINGLYWRDFYYNLILNNPHMLKNMIFTDQNSTFRKKFNLIKWNYNSELFEKWCQGKLGIPICDAGMIELNTTGNMHNRIRMLTSCVLCKLLLLPWQWGEKYFAQKLIDYDSVQNSGGWNWTIGGVDPNNVFRIFSPKSQNEKFDPNCEYVIRYIPELKTVPIKDIINWENSYEKYKGIYLPPCIDYSEYRKKAMEELKMVNKVM